MKQETRHRHVVCVCIYIYIYIYTTELLVAPCTLYLGERVGGRVGKEGEIEVGEEGREGFGIRGGWREVG